MSSSRNDENNKVEPNRDDADDDDSIEIMVIEDPAILATLRDFNSEEQIAEQAETRRLLDMCARTSPTMEIAWKRLWCTQLFKGRMRAEKKQKAASAKAAAAAAAKASATAAAEQTLHCSRTTDLEASNDLGQQALITLNPSSSSGDHHPNSIMVPPAGQEMAPGPPTEFYYGTSRRSGNGTAPGGR